MTDLGVSWSAYHSLSSRCVTQSEVSITSLLPLFADESKSVAMLRHSMDVIASSVHALNATHTPAIAADQPLFALLKSIQWN